MHFGQNGYLAANGSRIETPASIFGRTERLQPAYRSLNSQMADTLRETAATSPSYATPMVGIGGSRPGGLGFAFGDSWARTQRGGMEFSLPSGQVDTINMSLRYAFENVFVNKAMRLKTLFTTKGISNQTSDDVSNDFFDQVHRKLFLRQTFRKAVWMYYTVGIVPIIMSEPDEPLAYVELLDPRMVRYQRAFGKTTMYMVADAKMLAAAADPDGRNDPRNRDLWNVLPKSWKPQLRDARSKTVSGEALIKLKDGSYTLLENRYNSLDRSNGLFDGTPLQGYFSACEQYRMLMAGDFATAFLAKNIIALVSVGDPKAEGPDLYLRPDDNVLLGLQNTLQNPNQAMWVYADSTFNVRYITPGPEAFDNKKYSESKEHLKNLLPSPLWYNEAGGSFADATVEMQALDEESNACQNDFNDNFWQPIHERAAEGRPRIAAKHVGPPVYDRSALTDRVADIKSKNELHANGGLSMRTLIEAHGINYDTERQRLLDEKPDAKAGVFMPAFEQKQGIVAAKTYAIDKTAGAKQDGGKGGRPATGTRPQTESTTRRTPRPSERSK